MKNTPAIVTSLTVFILLVVGIWFPRPFLRTSEEPTASTPKAAPESPPVATSVPVHAANPPSAGSGQPAGPEPEPVTPGSPAPSLLSREDIRLAVARMEEDRLLRVDRPGPDFAEVDEVLFLRLRMTEHDLKLVSTDQQPGHPKRTGPALSLAPLGPSVVIQAADEQGKIVWQEAIQDPAVLRCCHAHAEQAGLMTGQTEIPDSAMFTVRLPDVPEITTVAFYRNLKPAKTLTTITTEENLMGRFDLR